MIIPCGKSFIYISDHYYGGEISDLGWLFLIVGIVGLFVVFLILLHVTISK